MRTKVFIITVDTEGDNLWNYRSGMPVTTENARYIPRFQELCEEFGFKPVYLTNYEMACSSMFVHNARNWLANDACEIGLHLHAWNNPPHVELNGPYNGQPYLIEYPEEVMREKIGEIYRAIESAFSVHPVSHRAGRWAMDERYFKILREFGIQVDCSVTPFISWESSLGITRAGSDYSRASALPGFIEGVYEVPMTVRHTHKPLEGSLKHRIKTLLFGSNVWLRPAVETLAAMKRLVDCVDRENAVDYLEFMIHSSELMPNGSPYNPTEKSVEVFYEKMRGVFAHVTSLGYEGATLAEYYQTRCEK